MIQINGQMKSSAAALAFFLGAAAWVPAVSDLCDSPAVSLDSRTDGGADKAETASAGPAEERAA